jgi:hypothetical protein
LALKAHFKGRAWALRAARALRAGLDALAALRMALAGRIGAARRIGAALVAWGLFAVSAIGFISLTSHFGLGGVETPGPTS